MKQYKSQSEIRIYRNKCRRRKVLQHKIVGTILTLCLILTMVLSISGFLSNARSDKDIVMYKYYSSITVEPGESLSSIASDYAGTKYTDLDEYMQEVMAMNYLKDENITAGQSILVPYYSSEFIQ